MKGVNGERNADYRWRCKDCAKAKHETTGKAINAMFTVRTGTIFEETRLPMRVWVYAFWKACSSKKGISASSPTLRVKHAAVAVAGDLANDVGVWNIAVVGQGNGFRAQCLALISDSIPSFEKLRRGGRQSLQWPFPGTQIAHQTYFQQTNKGVHRFVFTGGLCH